MASSAAAIPKIITVLPTLLSGRVVPEEGIKLDVDMEGAVPYIRRRLFKILRTCQFSLLLGKVEFVDPKVSASGAECPDGATLTIVRTNCEDNDQGWFWVKEKRKGASYNKVSLNTQTIAEIGLPCLEQALTKTSVANIWLTNCGLGDDEAEIVAEAVSTNPNITSLNLQANNIGDDGASYFSQLLNTYKKVEYFGDDGASYFSQVLNTNKIEYINLSDNKISDVGAVELAQALATNKNITNIDLDYNKISGIGVVKIGKVLEVNKTLHFLHLRFNNIQDAGAIAIASALEVNNTLLCLYLEGNKIQDDGAIAIANAIRLNSGLDHIGVGGNDYGDIGRNALQQAKEGRPISLYF